VSLSVQLWRQAFRDRRNSYNCDSGTQENTHTPRIGTTGYLLDSLTLKMGPTGCPETSVRNYHYSLHNNTEERSSEVYSTSTSKARPKYKKMTMPNEGV
jgi:hypothetical protein